MKCLNCNSNNVYTTAIGFTDWNNYNEYGEPKEIEIGIKYVIDHEDMVTKVCNNCGYIMLFDKNIMENYK